MFDEDDSLVCPHCDRQIHDDEGECPYCGEHLDSWKDGEE